MMSELGGERVDREAFKQFDERERMKWSQSRGGKAASCLSFLFNILPALALGGMREEARSIDVAAYVGAA